MTVSRGGRAEKLSTASWVVRGLKPGATDPPKSKDDGSPGRSPLPVSYCRTTNHKNIQQTIMMNNIPFNVRNTTFSSIRTTFNSIQTTLRFGKTLNEMALFLHFPFKYLPPRWFMLLTLTWVFILSKRNSCCVYAKFQRSKDDTFLSLLAHLFLLFLKKKVDFNLSPRLAWFLNIFLTKDG